MPANRFYHLNNTGHFESAPDIADLSDDEAAKEHAATPNFEGGEMAKPRKPRALGGVKAGASVKAEASAKALVKASYEVKKPVTRYIPEDVTRPRNSAWLDLISPLTEWAGAKEDELRYRRELLRIQREEALNAIAVKAAPKLHIISGKPVPNKFMVPFLEQASLEDPDSALIDLWAGLLVSVSEKFQSYHVHFVSIIGQLSSEQGEIFKKIIRTNSARTLELARDNILVGYSFDNASRLFKKNLRDIIDGGVKNINVSHVDDIISKMFMPSEGIDPVFVSFRNSVSDYWYELDTISASYKGEYAVDYSLLEAVGLIRRVEVTGSAGDWSFRAIYYHVTELGVHFAMSCGIVSAGNDT